MNPQDQDDVWIELADLFFLDTEHPIEFYRRAAQRLRERGMTRTEVERILTDEVAPIAGANLGYLLWPGIGEWTGFDKESMCRRIREHLDRRSRCPQWLYWPLDLWLRRMVKKLQPERLLSLL
jgi:hypothetical protein